MYSLEQSLYELQNTIVLGNSLFRSLSEEEISAAKSSKWREGSMHNFIFSLSGETDTIMGSFKDNIVSQ